MSEILKLLSLGCDQVSAFRLQRHHLDVRAARDRLPAVVGDTCGVQAQVTVMARIALWARIKGLTIDDVGRALHTKRTIVKTWSLRGALHLHRSSDLLNVVGGLMATRLLHHRRWIHRAGLKEEETTPMVLAALEDGPLTRGQLADRLNEKVGARTRNWRDGGWGVQKAGSSLAWYLVEPAMARGLVCFGPSEGREVTFVMMDHAPPAVTAVRSRHVRFGGGLPRVGDGSCDRTRVRASSGKGRPKCWTRSSVPTMTAVFRSRTPRNSLLGTMWRTSQQSCRRRGRPSGAAPRRAP